MAQNSTIIENLPPELEKLLKEAKKRGSAKVTITFTREHLPKFEDLLRMKHNTGFDLTNIGRAACFAMLAAWKQGKPITFEIPRS